MKYYKEKEYSKRTPIRQSKAFKGKLVGSKGNIPDDAVECLALSVIGNNVLASINGEFPARYVDCSVSGKVISPNGDSTLVAVGDNVKVIIENFTDSKLKGRILSVEQRYSKLSRKVAGKGKGEHVIASNFDNLIILVSTYQPTYSKRFIDRLIIASEIGGVKPCIVVNKIDLVEDMEFFKDDLQIYRQMDIPLFFVSANDNVGLETLMEFLTDKISLFFGPSGVGKSTIVNQLLGESIQQIREISERTNKGQHTTSFVKMLSLPFGGKIIDSPGVREFAMWDVDKLNLAMHYHDFDEYYLQCKYLPCSHIHEPDCAVIQALEGGLISPERYESYMNIYNTLES